MSRSAQDGLPIYRIRGGAGFVWAASFDARGRSTHRLVAIDASALQPETTAQPATPASAADQPQAGDQRESGSRDEPVLATRTVSDADGTIARLKSELALARDEKAQAEEAARLARTDAEMARKDIKEARSAADAASEEIDRLKQAGVAPSSFLDGNNAFAIGVYAAAVLMLGAWLGFRVSRWRAASPANGDADNRTEGVEATSLPSATDQTEASIDQDVLVRELGKQLGLEEVAAPSLAEPVSDNSLEPDSQPEPAAPPVAIAPEPTPTDSDVKPAAA
jgi:hypothetical protein